MGPIAIFLLLIFFFTLISKRIEKTILTAPIIAAGNPNGDLQMLTFAGGSSLPALRLLVVHDDAEREFEYDAGAEKILSAAQANSWTSISIKNDWRRVFPV